jgi:hypothetical protein
MIAGHDERPLDNGRGDTHTGHTQSTGVMPSVCKAWVKGAL